MSKKTNMGLIDDTKEITIAMLQNCGRVPNGENGKHVADFMQAIYDKLAELNEKA